MWFVRLCMLTCIIAAARTCKQKTKYQKKQMKSKEKAKKNSRTHTTLCVRALLRDEQFVSYRQELAQDLATHDPVCVRQRQATNTHTHRCSNIDDHEHETRFRTFILTMCPFEWSTVTSAIIVRFATTIASGNILCVCHMHDAHITSPFHTPTLSSPAKSRTAPCFPG